MCENPSVVEAAADALGTACAPLVCVAGQPSLAALLLLGSLTAGGAVLRYHGDAAWDAALRPALERRGSGVHEEQVLEALLADLADGDRAAR